jgi:hypothetical protein
MPVGPLDVIFFKTLQRLYPLKGHFSSLNDKMVMNDKVKEFS